MPFTPTTWVVSATGITGRVSAVFGSLISRGEDSVTIICEGPSADVLSAKTEVYVSAGSFLWKGEIQTSKKVGSDQNKSVVHQCRGLYYKLGEYTYVQPRLFVNPDTGVTYQSNSAFVTLFQSPGTVGEITNVSADAQIADAVSQTGLTLAECTTGLTLPWRDESGITVRGIIEMVVALAPKCAVWFDGDGALHIAPGPAVSLANLLSYNIGLRADLGVRGVVIENMATAEITSGGITTEKITQSIQSAGATTGPGICYIPIQSQGLRKSSRLIQPQKVSVETETIPSDLSASSSFWKSHIRDLEGVNTEDITISSPSVIVISTGSALDTEAFPRLALTTVPEATKKNSLRVRFSALASYPVIDANGITVRRNVNVKIAFDALATDATTREYTLSPGTTITEEEEAEYLPADCAANLFSAWNETFAEGSVSFHAKHLADVPVGGRITAQGVSGYIQSIQFDSRTNICTATVAPPDQSGLQSMVKLQKGMKYFSDGFATPGEVRQTADPSQGSARVQDVTQHTPDGSGGGSVCGNASRELQSDGSESPSKSVVRDLEDISDATASIKYRKLLMPVLLSDGAAVKNSVWTLAGEPADDASITETDATIYCKEFKLAVKLLGKTISGSTVYLGIRVVSKTEYTSADKRLLLQGTEPSTGTYRLDLDKGYLKT